MNEKKILIVDDDESILEAISLLLEGGGYSVETTLNGDEIYKKIRLFSPDVILLDVLISGSDGRVICKKLKEDKNTKAIPIIMISAHPNAKQAIHEYGADDFLEKPFESSDLLAKVGHYATFNN